MWKCLAWTLSLLLFSLPGADARGEETLTVKITAKGEFLIDGKTHSREEMTALFTERKADKAYQDPANPALVTYAVKIETDSDAPFEHIQWLMMEASRGGVTNIQTAITGNLPREKGLSSRPNETTEVRVRLRYRDDEKKSMLFVGREKIGAVGGDQAENKTVWADATKTLNGLRKTGKEPVVIDADDDVPWEHIVGIVNACKTAGIDDIEFTVPLVQATAPAGQWELDTSALLDELRKDNNMPAEMVKQMEEQMSKIKVTLDIASDGSFSVKANFMGGKNATAKGTWKLDGNKLTMSTTEEDGKAKNPPEVKVLTFKDGSITLEEGGMKMVFKCR